MALFVDMLSKRVWARGKAECVCMLSDDLLRFRRERKKNKNESICLLFCSCPLSSRRRQTLFFFFYYWECQTSVKYELKESRMRFSSPGGLVRSHLPFVCPRRRLSLCLFPSGPFFLSLFVSICVSFALRTTLTNFSHCPLVFVSFSSTLSLSVVFFGSLLSLSAPLAFFSLFRSSSFSSLLFLLSLFLSLPPSLLLSFYPFFTFISPSLLVYQLDFLCP